MPLCPTGAQFWVAWSRHLSERNADQAVMKHYYDRTRSSTARGFLPGEQVLVHNVRVRSVPATIVELKDDRTYLVEFENGSCSVRNRKFLMFMPRCVPVP